MWNRDAPVEPTMIFRLQFHPNSRGNTRPGNRNVTHTTVYQIREPGRRCHVGHIASGEQSFTRQ